MKKFIAIMVVCMFFLSMGITSDFSFAGAASPKCKYGSQGKGKLEEKFYKTAWLAMKNAEELGLTEEQVDKIKALKFQVKKDVITKTAEIEILGVDIKEQMWEDKLDVQAINKIVDKKYELKKEKTKYIISAIANLRNIIGEDNVKMMKKMYFKSK